MDKEKLEDQYSRLYSFNQRILDNVPVSIMVINDDGKIVSVNKHFLNFTGSDKPVGRLIYDVDFFKRENLIEAYEKLFKTGRSFSKNDCQTVNKSGETKYLNIIAVPMKDSEGKKVGALSMAIDNTENHLYQRKLIELNRELENEVVERVAAEAQVKKLSELNQKILDNAPFSIVMMDKSGAIIGANRMALDLMETSEDSLIGKKLVDTQEIRNDFELADKFEKLLADGRMFYYDNLSYIKNITGEHKHLNIIAVPLLDKDGRVEGAISIATDNTEALEAKKKLTRLNEDLEYKVSERTREYDKINRRLTDVLDMKAKFVADASHELRTPLTIIRGNIDLAVIKLRKEGREIPEMFEVILQEVDHMRGVLSDLSILSNENIGDNQMNYEVVDIGAILWSIIKSMRLFLGQKNISVKLDVIPGSVRVMGDAVKLEKLFSNIIRNAIKYTDAAGHIDISLKSDDSGAVVAVEDSGIGIAAEDLPHIFERFYRVDRARITDESGSGLGLSIVKLIADAHSGAIDVKSEIGKGSIFSVFLPFDHKKHVDKRLKI